MFVFVYINKVNYKQCLAAECTKQEMTECPIQVFASLKHNQSNLHYSLTKKLKDAYTYSVYRLKTLTNQL